MASYKVGYTKFKIKMFIISGRYSCLQFQEYQVLNWKLHAFKWKRHTRTFLKLMAT